MNYYRRFPGDYLRDTIHLSAAEDGMYGRLLDAQYTSERPLPLDRAILYAAVRANSAADKRAVESVLTQFFRETKRGFSNQRVEKEIARIRAKSDTYRANGRKGGLSRKAIAKQSPSEGSSKTQASQTLDSRLQTPQQERENLPPAKTAGLKPTAEFLMFWESYPKKLAKQEALKAWIRRGCEGRLGEVLASLKAWADVEWKGREREFIPHPATWLNADRWKEMPQRASGQSLEQQLRNWEATHGQGSKPHAN